RILGTVVGHFNPQRARPGPIALDADRRLQDDVAQFSGLATFGRIEPTDPLGEPRDRLANRLVPFVGPAGELELSIFGKGSKVRIPVRVVDGEQVARHQILDFGAILRVAWPVTWWIG